MVKVMSGDDVGGSVTVLVIEVTFGIVNVVVVVGGITMFPLKIGLFFHV